MSRFTTSISIPGSYALLSPSISAPKTRPSRSPPPSSSAGSTSSESTPTSLPFLISVLVRGAKSRPSTRPVSSSPS
ncbi:hypothetical protein ACFX2B_003853 [Malus domestica]